MVYMVDIVHYYKKFSLDIENLKLNIFIHSIELRESIFEEVLNKIQSLRDKIHLDNYQLLDN